MGVSEHAVLWIGIKYLWTKYILYIIDTAVGVIVIKCEESILYSM
jgi:hypothetical protein